MSPTESPTASPILGFIICHKIRNKKKKKKVIGKETIEIPKNAWKKHKKHGDTRGPCPTESPTLTPTVFDDSVRTFSPTREASEPLIRECRCDCSLPSDCNVQYVINVS